MALATLGERLRWVRNMAGISARELDRLADKNEGHAAVVETKIHDRAALWTIVDYANVLGVSLGWLATGEGDPPTRAAVCLAVEVAQKRIRLPAETARAANDKHSSIRKPRRRSGAAA
jgi:hypothetical protein